MSDGLPADLLKTLIDTTDGRDTDEALRNVGYLPTDDDIGYDSADETVITLQSYSRSTHATAVSRGSRYVEGECGNCGCNRIKIQYADPEGVAFRACPVCKANSMQDDGPKLEVVR